MTGKHMTRVYIERDGDRVLLTADGHATGSEQVCAAVSCLLSGLAGYLQNMQEEGRATVYRMELAQAQAIFHYFGDEAVMGATELVMLSLAQLELSYGDYIVVEIQEI